MAKIALHIQKSVAPSVFQERIRSPHHLKLLISFWINKAFINIQKITWLIQSLLDSTWTMSFWLLCLCLFVKYLNNEHTTKYKQSLRALSFYSPCFIQRFFFTLSPHFLSFTRGNWGLGNTHENDTNNIDIWSSKPSKRKYRWLLWDQKKGIFFLIHKNLALMKKNWIKNKLVISRNTPYPTVMSLGYFLF